MPKVDNQNQRERMKTDALQTAIARAAVNLDQARGLLVQVRGQEEVAALLAPEEKGEGNPVPYFLGKVAAVMTAAHALRERKLLTGEERAIRSKAIRLQAALLGEGSLDSYITRALRDHEPAPPDELEELPTSVRKALSSLSGSALAFSAMLRNASELSLDVGLSQEQMASITEAIETLARHVSVLEPLEAA